MEYIEKYSVFMAQSVVICLGIITIAVQGLMI